MLEIEVLGAAGARSAPLPSEVRVLCEAAAASAGVRDGHVAVEFVRAARIAELNALHRGRAAATDVLSFPVDGAEPHVAGMRELGDIVICPELTADVREAVVHGMLHLLGMDHETDSGEMLALQHRLLEAHVPARAEA
jgi:probable rRNA maturation factor